MYPKKNAQESCDPLDSEILGQFGAGLRNSDLLRFGPGTYRVQTRFIFTDLGLPIV